MDNLHNFTIPAEIHDSCRDTLITSSPSRDFFYSMEHLPSERVFSSASFERFFSAPSSPAPKDEELPWMQEDRPAGIVVAESGDTRDCRLPHLPAAKNSNQSFGFAVKVEDEITFIETVKEEIKSDDDSIDSLASVEDYLVTPAIESYVKKKRIFSRLKKEVQRQREIEKAMQEEWESQAKMASIQPENRGVPNKGAHTSPTSNPINGRRESGLLRFLSHGRSNKISTQPADKEDKDQRHTCKESMFVTEYGREFEYDWEGLGPHSEQSKSSKPSFFQRVSTLSMRVLTFPARLRRKRREEHDERTLSPTLVPWMSRLVAMGDVYGSIEHCVNKKHFMDVLFGDEIRQGSMIEYANPVQTVYL